MLKKRLIAVLILRDGSVVQSVRFKHTNVIHYDAVHAIESFNRWAVDEIAIINVSRSPDSRDAFAEEVKRISRKCFVPLSVGGWVTTEAYADKLLHSGADKLILNSAWESDPGFASRLARLYGRQCMVASMDVIAAENGFQAATDRARKGLGIAPADWAKRLESLGAGEILFNSVSHDGARKGYHLEELAKVCGAVEIPVIAFGGVFTWGHLVEGLNAGASAAAAANIFHYTEQSTRKAKKHLVEAGIALRREE